MIRVLLVTSFAGSSRYLEPLLPLLKDKVSVMLVATGVGADVLIDDGIKVDAIVNSDPKDISDIFNLFKPDVIFVIPQFNSSIEQFSINEARNRKVPSVAAIDHWSLYKERFSQTDHNNEVIDYGFQFMPDMVLVNDSIAYQEAINSGIPASCLRISGNPVLEYRWLDYNLDLLNKNSVNKSAKNKRTILFVSEPYSTRMPIGSRYYNGFTEIDVLHDLLDVLPLSFELLIKPHPSELSEKFLPFVEKFDNCRICKGESIDKLLLNVDKVVGMSSTLLLEIAIIRESVISYRPSERVEFIGNRLGFTNKITSKHSLRLALREDSSFRSKSFGLRYNGSAIKIVDFILNLC